MTMMSYKDWTEEEERFLDEEETAKEATFYTSCLTGDSLIGSL